MQEGSRSEPVLVRGQNLQFRAVKDGLGFGSNLRLYKILKREAPEEYEKYMNDPDGYNESAMARAWS